MPVPGLPNPADWAAAEAGRASGAAWRCAYGGNHVMMTAVQLLAARWAGIDRLRFHAWDEKGEGRFLAGSDMAELVEEAAPGLEFDAVVDRLLALRLRWGTGDGN